MALKARVDGWMDGWMDGLCILDWMARMARWVDNGWT